MFVGLEVDFFIVFHFAFERRVLIWALGLFGFVNQISWSMFDNSHGNQRWRRFSAVITHSVGSFAQINSTRKLFIRVWSGRRLWERSPIDPLRSSVANGAMIYIFFSVLANYGGYWLNGNSIPFHLSHKFTSNHLVPLTSSAHNSNRRSRAVSFVWCFRFGHDATWTRDHKLPVDPSDDRTLNRTTHNVCSMRNAGNWK